MGASGDSRAVEQAAGDPATFSTGGWRAGDYFNPYNLGGISGGYFDPGLLYIIGVLELVSVWLWVKLVWADSDPGIVDTRFSDFDEVCD